MADQDKQEWADALAALHAGHHDDEPEEHDEPDPDGEAPESAGQTDDSEAEQEVASASPPPPPPQPRRSRRPSSPIEALRGSTAPPATASETEPVDAPSPSAQPLEQNIAPGDEAGVPADFMAAAPAVVRPRPRPIPRPGASHLIQTIGYRRTIIPVLLTSAFILWLFAAWMVIRSGSAILDDISPIYPAIMAGGGFVLLILAVLNMIQVKRQFNPDRVTPSEE